MQSKIDSSQKELLKTEIGTKNRIKSSAQARYVFVKRHKP